MADVLAEASVAQIRRGLRRRFLRYGLTEQLDAAADAAVGLIQTVLEAKDAEIIRLRARVAELEQPDSRRPRTGRRKPSRTAPPRSTHTRSRSGQKRELAGPAEAGLRLF